MIGRLIAPTSVRIAAARRGARRLLDRAPQRDHAEIHQEQHQHRGEPRVPHPIGAPHRPAPQRAGDEAEEREGGADRRRGLGGDVGERMPPHQRAERRDAHQRPAEHAEPGRRHVDEHDLHGRALLVVVRRAVGEIEPDREGERGRSRSATAARARRARESASDWRGRSGPSGYLRATMSGRNVAVTRHRVTPFLPQRRGGGKYADHEARSASARTGS